MALATRGSRLAGFVRERPRSIRAHCPPGGCGRRASGEWIGRTVGKLATPGRVFPGIWWQGPQVAVESSPSVLASEGLSGYRGPQDPCDYPGGSGIRDGESQAAYDARSMECNVQTQWEIEQDAAGADWYEEPLQDFARAGLDSLFDSLLGDEFEARPRRRPRDLGGGISPTTWWILGGVGAAGVATLAIVLGTRKKKRA